MNITNEHPVWKFVVLALICLIMVLYYVKVVPAQGPYTFIGPDGSPTFVYPGTAPGQPMTVLPPTGGPIFGYPPANNGAGQSFIDPPIGRGPSSTLTIVPPVGGPTFAYPPIGQPGTDRGFYDEAERATEWGRRP